MLAAFRFLTGKKGMKCSRNRDKIQKKRNPFHFVQKKKERCFVEYAFVTIKTVSRK